MAYDIEKRANAAGADHDVSPSKGSAPGKSTRSQLLPAASAATTASTSKRGYDEPFGSRIGQPRGAPLQAKESKEASLDAPKAASPEVSGDRSVKRKREGTKKESELTVENADAKPYVRNPELEPLLAKMTQSYIYQCISQGHEVTRLKEEAEKQDPPPLLDTLLVAGAEIALAGALGGVGKLIENGVTGTSEDAAVKVIAKSIASGGKEFGKKATRAAAGTLVSKGAASTTAFWAGQLEALVATAERHGELFLEKAELLRYSANGLEQARALRKAQKAASGSVRAIQRMHSLDQWCNYLQHTESRKSGGVIENHLGKMEARRVFREKVGHDYRKGELILVLAVGKPGSKPELKWGAIGGLNKMLRAELEARPLKDIRIWKNVEVSLNGAVHSFAISPDGTETKSKGTSRRAGEWLTERAKLAGQYGKGEEILVNEDMAELNLKGKLKG